MTKLLEKAFQEAGKLSAEEQDALARIVLEEVEDYRELQDPEVQGKIEKSNKDIRARRTQPAAHLLEEAQKELSGNDAGDKP